ncbi:MAG TPA: hypothetical protein VEK07_22870 [Polyangiaceae bacterium]|nr:hypothetical protein [Polyangiaceae bacterium]
MQASRSHGNGRAMQPERLGRRSLARAGRDAALRHVPAAGSLAWVALLVVGCSSTQASTNAALITQGSPAPPSASGVLEVMQSVPKPAAPAGSVAERSAGPSTAAAALPFQAAASSFREQVQLLEIAPATYGVESVRRAVATLADALESVPFAQDVDVVDAARTMREELPDDVGGGQADAATASLHVRRALQTAAGALYLLAHGPYASALHFTDGAEQFEKTAGEIAPNDTVPDQRRRVIAALRTATDVLSDFEWPAGVVASRVAPGTMGPTAATAGPSPAPPAGAPGAAEAQGVSSAAGAQGVPPPREVFASALWVYSASVDRFVLRPVAQAPEALREAFSALADAIAAIPSGGDATSREAASQGAAAVRALTQEFARAAPLSIEQSILARRLFELAGGALSAATERKGGASPTVAAGIRDMHREDQAIADRPLDSQLRHVFDSLEAAEHALRAIAMTTASG